MSRLGLSPEEAALVRRFAATTGGRRQVIGFHAALLTPLIAFGVYGIAAQELGTLAIAFLCVCASIVWRASTDVARYPLFHSVFSKIDAFESERGGPV